MNLRSDGVLFIGSTEQIMNYQSFNIKPIETFSIKSGGIVAMVQIEKMTKDELIEVIRIKDELLREQREELDAYRELVEELQAKLGINDSVFTGNGD